jgi:hypothetical protein
LSPHKTRKPRLAPGFSFAPRYTRLALGGLLLLLTALLTTLSGLLALLTGLLLLAALLLATLTGLLALLAALVRILVLVHVVFSRLVPLSGSTRFGTRRSGPQR